MTTPCTRPASTTARPAGTKPPSTRRPLPDGSCSRARTRAATTAPGWHTASTPRSPLPSRTTARPGGRRGGEGLARGPPGGAAPAAGLGPGRGAAPPLEGSEMVARAQHLFAAATAIDPATAVVAWLGYEPPGPAAALLDDAA